MPPEDAPTTTPSLHDPNAEVVAFLKGRSFPCPRCAYDLRDIQAARCPECAEPLVLKIGSPKARFGWLIFAMVPGCFSGVTAVFVLIPIVMTAGRQFPPGEGLPWPVVAADIFGFLSAASVGFMYKHRHRIMAWSVFRQEAFAAAVWGFHILVLALHIVAMLNWR